MFFLFETFLINDIVQNVASIFREYEIYTINATRAHNLGRAIGGCLYGFKKSIKKKYSFKFEIADEYVYVSAKLNGKQINFIPAYLNNNQDWEGDFKRLEKVIQQCDSENLCIIGDLNARIGDKQELDYRLLIKYPQIAAQRKSKDLVINNNGKKILELMDNIGGIILNGRTTSDIEGEKTFIGSMGTSVIDYASCSINVIENLIDMKIISKPYSDHMPISITFETDNKEIEEKESLSLLPKLKWNQNKIDQYQTETGCNMSILINENVDRNVQCIKNVIYEFENKNRIINSFKPKKKWYDSVCAKARDQMFKYLNLMRKYNNVSEFKTKYLGKVKFYKDTCKHKMQIYYQNQAVKLSMVKDAKEWWAVANEYRQRIYIVSQHIKANDFANYFRELLNPLSGTFSIYDVEPYVYEENLDGDITIEELKMVLKRAKDGKAPGLDRIPYEYYKNANDEFLIKLCQIQNKIYSTGNTPESYHKAIIFPIFKKGDANLVENYRGLSFTDTDYKIFTGILLSRITEWVNDNNILNEFQAGFRKNYSTIDNIFCLSNLVHMKLQVKKKLYAFFVDFKSAFDTINRQALFFKLSKLKMSTKMLDIIRKLYENTSSVVWNGQTISEYFETGNGLKQGCLLSPMLFSLFINDLYEELPVGLTIDDMQLKLLMYADDLVLLAEDPFTLQKMIDNLCIYCKKWNLVVNLQKSKILIFRNGGRKAASETWKYDDKDIEIVNQYKYLGILFTHNLNFNKHLKEKLSVSKFAINQTWNKIMRNKTIQNSSKIKIFESCIKTILCYGSQVWGINEYDEVEKLQRFFFKKMYYLPNNTPNYMLYLETDKNKIYIHTLKTHFDYIRKVINMPNSRLTKIIAKKILEMQIYWVKEWKDLYDQVGLIFTYNPQNWNVEHNSILNKLSYIQKCENMEHARLSIYHNDYSTLQYIDVPNYFCDKNSVEMISLILKARGGMLDINARAFKQNTDGICNICNLDESENTYHFIARCPIFKNERKLYFGKEKITFNEFRNCMNGKLGYEPLYNYLKLSLKYRNLIIKEFE